MTAASQDEYLRGWDTGRVRGIESAIKHLQAHHFKAIDRDELIAELERMANQLCEEFNIDRLPE